MKQTSARSLTASLAFVAAMALAAGCTDDGPLAPARDGTGVEGQLADRAGAQPVAIVDSRNAQLAVCPNLQVPVPSVLARAVYAEGVQIYSWDGTTWAFVAPDAQLFANSHGQGVVGTHYAGPTWESNSGSEVRAAVVDRCTPDPDAIPWLLLTATSSDGPGIFRGVTHIQRLNTAGGLAPVQPGTFIGQEARVPYTANYYFFRTH